MYLNRECIETSCVVVFDEMKLDLIQKLNEVLFRVYGFVGTSSEIVVTETKSGFEDVEHAHSIIVWAIHNCRGPRFLEPNK